MARALLALGLSCVVCVAWSVVLPAADAQPAGSSAGALGEVVFPGGEETHAALLARLRNESVTQLRPVGTTSVVLRARDGDVTLGAYRPAATTHPRGHVHEIAAYRIAEHLGLDNVPPTVSRMMTTSDVERRLDANYTDRWPGLRERLIVGHADVIQGSMTYWIPVMRELGLDQGDALREWSAKLRHGSRLESDTYPRTLLRDLSNCVLFDYVIGNTDRFSGANLQGLPDRSRVFIRDHNLAFFEELTPARRERLNSALQRSERFSRTTVERLLALTPAALEAALARDPLHSAATPLLTPAQVSALLARRSTALSYIGALVDQHGSAAVLVFD
ncbi:MAG: hypothetical protein KC593_22705 [Myxococcales bacterium]|nr:hypothetical protein [Myxococcales bacterium]